MDWYYSVNLSIIRSTKELETTPPKYRYKVAVAVAPGWTTQSTWCIVWIDLLYHNRCNNQHSHGRRNTAGQVELQETSMRRPTIYRGAQNELQYCASNHLHNRWDEQHSQDSYTTASNTQPSSRMTGTCPRTPTDWTTNQPDKQSKPQPP